MSFGIQKASFKKKMDLGKIYEDTWEEKTTSLGHFFQN